MNESTGSNEKLIDESLLRGEKKSRMKRALIWTVFAAAAVALIAAGIMIVGGEKQSVSYITQPAKRMDMVVTVSATGNLEPTNTVDVGIEVSGTIKEVLVDYNDPVRVGQVLARLDTVKLASKAKSSKAAYQAAKAELAESEVALADSENEYERLQRMFKATEGNFPSDKELDVARFAYQRAVAVREAALAQVEKARASWQSDEDDLRKAVVVSPMNGIVLDRKVDPGQTVAASLQTPVLFVLAEDLTRMEVVVSVDEADVGAVKEGQEVTFTVDAYPKRTFEGKVTQVRLNSVIIDGVVTYEAVVEVDNTEGLLRPGMTATADIITRRVKDALMVSNAALRYRPLIKGEARTIFSGPPRGRQEPSTENSEPAVWVLKGDTPVRVPVKTGDTDGVMRIILEGDLHPGDAVIVSEKEG
jgi:HlyD family secretion protein